MLKSKLKTVAYIILAFVLLCCFNNQNMYINASDNSNITIINNISLNAVSPYVTLIDGFNDKDLPYSSSGQLNVSDINTADFISPLPLRPFEGERCMKIQSINSYVNEWRHVNFTYDTPLDMSGSDCFFFAVNCPDFGGKYKVSVTLQSDYGIFTSEADIKSECWNGVFLNISSFTSRSSVSKITIGVKCDFDSEITSDYSFYIDMFAVSNDAYAGTAVNYLTSNYMTMNGMIDIYNDVMRLTVTGESPFIETYSFDSSMLRGANSIKIKFANNAGCSAMTLFYTTDDSVSYTAEHSSVVSVDKDTQTQTCCFTIPENIAIEQIRIVFNNASGGFIDIYSITPSRTYIPTPTGLGSIEKCSIASNKREIVVTGTLTDESAERFKGLKLYLYELIGNQNEQHIINGILAPVAETKVDSSFKIKLQIDSSDTKKLVSKYVVAVTVDDSIIIIDHAKYITNPEMMAYNKLDNRHKEYSIKGMQTNYLTEAQTAGIKNTVIDVLINRLISFDENDYNYTFENKVYYFSKAYVDRLDKRVKPLSDAGINISLSLLIQSDSDVKNNILIHPESNKNYYSRYYAFNTATEEGISYIRAVCRFLSERYTDESREHGYVKNFIVGNEVCFSFQNYNIGNVSLDKFVKTYAEAFRLIYNTVRSVCSDLSVYISLDSRWDENLPLDVYTRYDNRAFLDTFAAYIKDTGDIQWNLAFNPYPSTETDYKVMSDTVAGTDYETDYITPRNIELLCSYMNRRSMQHNSQTRSIILIGKYQGTMPASEYAYMYYKLNTSNFSAVKAFIINRQTEFKEVFKYIDTDRSYEFTDPLKSDFNISEWAEIIIGFNEAGNIKHSVQNGYIVRSLSNSIGEYTLCSFKSAENNHGWQAGESCRAISSGNDILGGYGMLKVELGNTDAITEYAGISRHFDYNIDFRSAPFICFDIQIATLPEKVSSAELMLTVYSGDDAIEASAAIREGEWNKVVFDISKFKGLASVDRMKIWVRGVEGKENIGTPTLVISDIKVRSVQYEDEQLKKMFESQRDDYLKSSGQTVNMSLVRGLIILIIVTGSVGIIYVLSRNNDEENER